MCTYSIYMSVGFLKIAGSLLCCWVLSSVFSNMEVDRRVESIRLSLGYFYLFWQVLIITLFLNLKAVKAFVFAIYLYF